MATITLGLATSHAPQLSTPPEEWGQRAAADHRNPALAFRGEDYTYDELAALRPSFAEECRLEVSTERYDRSRAAITELGHILRSAEVDALVVISSDHKELFDDELLSPFAFYWGDEVGHEPFTQADLDVMPPGLAIAEVRNVPEVSTTRRTDSALAQHLIRGVSDAGFDPAGSRRLPAGAHKNHGIPHGWGFVFQQILGGDADIPVVPVFVNTFYEPNPPRPDRCFDFGVALGAAIASYPKEATVAVVASGGLSHFVLDEDLDRRVLAALGTKDREYLRSLPAEALRAGTSEIRSWLVAAGAMAATPLEASVVDYLPCYRTEAGTGCGMGFVAWRRP